ncbi:MAG: protein translocase subunit SecF [Alphaproteobacteria bacterium]|nr:protein translocase subunit SecF [Alphaproteobacteria bacterium]
MFRLTSLIPTDTKIDFVGKRRVALSASVLAIVASILSVMFLGLNFGIDFAGGVLIEIRTQAPPDLAGMRSKLNGLGLGDVELQGAGGGENAVMIRLSKQVGDETAQNAALTKVKESLGPEVEYRRIELVGPKVGAELVEDGILAVTLAILAIGAYVWFQFEWQFAIGGMLALVHDAATTVGLFSLLGLEFNLTTVAAVLTIAGYSINDSVVVFDRVRENLRKYKKMPMDELLNLSTNETLSRTILTGGTTLLAVLSIYLFGGDVLKGFGFAMIWGILVGTYSSIYVGMPILIYFNLRSTSGGIDADKTGEEDGEEDKTPGPAAKTSPPHPAAGKAAPGKAVATKPAPTKPVPAKPTSTKPAPAKPTATKPAPPPTKRP